MMFTKDVTNLKNVAPVAKIIITAFLVLAGIGYLLGFFNILLTYSLKDTQPGLSLKDIEYSFYGKRSTTTLEKAVDGTMKEYFGSDADYQVAKDWLQAGAKEDVFNSKVKPIFTNSCSTCHSTEAQAGQVVTENYSDLGDLLKNDTGKTVGRLVSLSHTHLMATLVIIFILNFIFFYTGVGETFKKIMAVISFSAIVLDIGAWWLAKLAPFFSVFVILGGATLGLSFMVMILIPLYEIFLKKAK